MLLLSSCGGAGKLLTWKSADKIKQNDSWLGRLCPGERLIKTGPESSGVIICMYIIVSG